MKKTEQETLVELENIQETIDLKELEIMFLNEKKLKLQKELD